MNGPEAAKQDILSPKGDIWSQIWRPTSKSDVKIWSLTSQFDVMMLLASKFVDASNTTLCTARQGDMKWKKILKDSWWCDKNGLNESFKMSPHLICLTWHFNFHIISRPYPEAGHKRDLGCQPRPIKWGLISQLSFRAFSWHVLYASCNLISNFKSIFWVEHASKDFLICDEL